MATNPEYVAEHVYEFDVPFRITPSALAVHMRMLGEMYPAQFINGFWLNYDEKKNRTNVRVVTNGERWPGQFDFKENELRPVNPIGGY